MKLLAAVLLTLPFLRSVTALCNVTGLNAPYPTNLQDLRTPTPYTWTLSADVTGCATAPQTLTLYETWLVNGTQFPAQNTGTVTFSLDGTTFMTFTFPGMTVTSLFPGEPITLLDQSANQVVYHVPVGATPYPSTSTPSSTSSPTTSTVFATTTVPSTTPTTTSTSPAPSSTSSSSSASGGSSTPVGGIIAGSVVGGIAVFAILGFTIYKINRHRSAAAAQQSYEDYYAAYPEGVEHAQQGQNGPGGKGPGMQDVGYTQRQNLRYPDEEGGVSANLRPEI